MKKLLLYAHYFYPDVASTAQIYTQLCEELSSYFDITVICAVPSYKGNVDRSYQLKKIYFEKYKGIRIIRVKVPEFNKENKLSRVKNILAYYFHAVCATKLAGRQDIVFAVSQPPILGGMLGVVGKRKTKGKLVYNIQDFNPEQTQAVGYTGKFLIKTALWLDKHSCRSSDLVITVGHDMQKTLERRFAGMPPLNCVINNWADETKIYPLDKTDPCVADFRKRYGMTDKFVIMYSGNLGLYYDLENIIKIIGELKEDSSLIFAFVGAGALQNQLKAYCRDKNLKNVVFIPYQDAADLIYSLNAADVHLVTNSKGIKGVSVPSKIYGVMCTNVPVLGILEKGSEAWNIVEDSDCGILAETGDYKAIRSAFKTVVEQKQNFVTRHSSGREYLCTHFTKSKAIRMYADRLQEF